MAQLHLMTALYILSTRAEKVIRPLLILPGHIARLKARNPAMRSFADLLVESVPGTNWFFIVLQLKLRDRPR
jgi:hypothetical protein